MATDLTPWAIIEEATAFPAGAFPAYIGSGSDTLGLDGSGLQGLNHGVQRVFGAMPDSGDLYWVQHGRVGDHVTASNALPFGYLAWEMEIDGERIDASTLAQQASLWRREVRVDAPAVRTSMLLAEKLTLTLNVWMPHGSSTPVVDVELALFDRFREKKARKVRLQLYWHLTTRKGVPIYDRLLPGDASDDAHAAEPQAGGVRSGSSCHSAQWQLEVDGHEHYVNRIAVAASPVSTSALVSASASSHVSASAPVLPDTAPRVLAFEQEAHRIGAAWELEIGAAPHQLRIVFSTQGRSAAEALAAGHAGHAQAQQLRTQQQQAHEAHWSAYYRSCAAIDGLSVKEAFLYHQSLQLFHSGFEYRNGLTIGMPYYFPWCWKASTFWDSHYIMDALLRAGRHNEVRLFIDFLLRSMKPQGKPFSWMFLYDGTSTVDEASDIAPLVIAAHAMTAIRAYEMTLDEQWLAEQLFPIVRAAAIYAVDKLFRQKGEDWILAEPVSNDVVEDEASDLNQSFTCLWFTVVLAKALAYAKRLNLEHELPANTAAIVEKVRLEADEEQYLHAQGISAAAAEGASWVPFLLYPTDGTPWLELDKFARTRARHSFADLYWEKQGDIQPWTCFIQANSDYRLGDARLGDEAIRDGLRHAHGPGYFSEIGPMQETVGLPPYISAHGSYVSAQLYRFIWDSIWERSLFVFPDLRRLPTSGLDIRNLYVSAGRRINASYRPGRISICLYGPQANEQTVVRIGLPEGLEAKDITVTLDGHVHEGHKEGDVWELVLPAQLLTDMGVQLEVKWQS